MALELKYIAVSLYMVNFNVKRYLNGVITLMADTKLAINLLIKPYVNRSIRFAQNHLYTQHYYRHLRN